MISLEMDLVDPQVIKENLKNRSYMVASELLRTQRKLLEGKSVVNIPQAEAYVSGLKNDLRFVGNLIESFKSKIPH